MKLKRRKSAGIEVRLKKFQPAICAAQIASILEGANAPE